MAFEIWAHLPASEGQMKSQMNCKCRTLCFWNLTAIKVKKADYLTLCCFDCVLSSCLLNVSSKSHNFVKVQH